MITGSKFRDRMTTRINTHYPGEPLLPESRLFFIGSCFSQNISARLAGLFMNVNQSPFGPSYNPLSIAKSIDIILNPSLFNPEEVFCHNGLFSHFDFHSDLSTPDRNDFINRAETAVKNARQNLLYADFLIVTPGTAFYFLNNRTEKIVNNCHKLPSEEFTRDSTPVETAEEAFNSACRAVQSVNPGIKIIFTLSPVRHLRDTPTENSYSKAVLRCAIENVIRKDQNRFYFPSYEILLDELRDYRWYGADRVHPSEEASDYIASRFLETMGNSETEIFVREAGKLAASINHKILHPGTEEAKKFKENLKKEIKDFEKKYPGLKI